MPRRSVLLAAGELTEEKEADGREGRNKRQYTNERKKKRRAVRDRGGEDA